MSYSVALCDVLLISSFLLFVPLRIRTLTILTSNPTCLDKGIHKFSRFQEVDEDDEVESCRAQSAPGRVDCDTPRSMLSEDLRLSGDVIQAR